MKLSKREIFWQMKVSKTAVHNDIKKFQNEGIFKDGKRSGCPRISSIRDDRIIRKVVSQCRMSSAKKIQAEMVERGIKISEKTIRCRLSIDFGHLGILAITRSSRMLEILRQPDLLTRTMR